MLLSSLKRITSSGNYIPEIDALRFISIVLVVCCHINELLFAQPDHYFIESKESYSELNQWMKHGYFGVDIFFAISGFILALPFASLFRKSIEFPSLKSYFIRRIKRLEPPYLISLIILFIIIVFILKLKSFQYLFPSFFASLFYSHNFVYDRSVLPLVNNVSWSLEIEIQFYILAPFFIYFLYKYFQSESRKLFLLFLMIGICSVSKFWKPSFYSLYEYFHYFLVGILTVEFYLDHSSAKFSSHQNWTKSIILLPVLVAILVGLKFSDITYMGLIHPALKVFLSLTQLSLLLVLFYLSLIVKWWNKFFTLSWVCIIGGMCYSIYLVHNPVISAVGYKLFDVYHNNFFYITYQIYFPLLFVIVLAVSILYYKLVEQPFMNKKQSGS
ncbi:MAG TPA: acyltransferase [Saprospiraceae bacterium]|nr:acyltransferase [Saprospiraceae bacterium]